MDYIKYAPKELRNSVARLICADLVPHDICKVSNSDFCRHWEIYIINHSTTSIPQLDVPQHRHL